MPEDVVAGAIWQNVDVVDVGGPVAGVEFLADLRELVADAGAFSVDAKSGVLSE